MWQNYTNAFFGLCLLVVSFMGLDIVSLNWATGIIGLFVLVLGFWGGAEATASGSGSQHMHA